MSIKKVFLRPARNLSYSLAALTMSASAVIALPPSSMPKQPSVPIQEVFPAEYLEKLNQLSPSLQQQLKAQNTQLCPEEAAVKVSLDLKNSRERISPIDISNMTRDLDNAKDKREEAESLSKKVASRIKELNNLIPALKKTVEELNTQRLMIKNDFQKIHNVELPIELACPISYSAISRRLSFANIEIAALRKFSIKLQGVLRGQEEL